MSLGPVDIAQLDSPERLESANRGLLGERSLDPVLQAIAGQAAEVTGYPIALVSLVLKRTQFFRAHVGLPEDLQVSRATDRSISFCQYAVSSGAPVVVADASKHPEMPQHLVENYGLRAYAGVPVRLGKQILGTLCVLNTEPHELTAIQLGRLAELGKRVEERLAALALGNQNRGKAQQVALEPAFGEINNLLMSSMGATFAAQRAVRELDSVFALLQAQLTAGAPRESLMPPPGVLDEATRARQDLEAALQQAARAGEALTQTFAAMRKMLIVGDEVKQLVADVIETATEVALHATKIAGGVRWSPVDPGLAIAVGERVPSQVLSAALSLIAGSALKHGRGIDGRVRTSADGASADAGNDDPSRDDTVSFTLSAPGVGSDELKSIASGLAMMLGGAVELHVLGETLVLEFRRA